MSQPGYALHLWSFVAAPSMMITLELIFCVERSTPRNLIRRDLSRYLQHLSFSSLTSHFILSCDPGSYSMSIFLASTVLQHLYFISTLFVIPQISWWLASEMHSTVKPVTSSHSKSSIFHPTYHSSYSSHVLVLDVSGGFLDSFEKAQTSLSRTRVT